MRLIPLLAALLLAPIAALAQTSTVVSMQFAGATRMATLYVPAVCKGVRCPLMIVFHGDGGTGVGMVSITGFDGVADGWGFDVAYPETAADPSAAHGTAPAWNIRPGGDAAFTAALVAQLVASGAVDPSQVYAAGYSEGGGMAIQAARQNPGLIRGLGLVAVELHQDAGGMPPAGMPGVDIHGTADPVSPFGGGPNATTGAPTLSFQQSVQEWASLNGCTDPPVVDGNTQTWSGGECVAPVVGIAVPGGGHTWPGGGQTGSKAIGVVEPSPQASLMIWIDLP